MKGAIIPRGKDRDGWWGKRKQRETGASKIKLSTGILQNLIKSWGVCPRVGYNDIFLSFLEGIGLEARKHEWTTNVGVTLHAFINKTVARPYYLLLQRDWSDSARSVFHPNACMFSVIDNDSDDVVQIMCRMFLIGTILDRWRHWLLFTPALPFGCHAIIIKDSREFEVSGELAPNTNQ